MLPQWIIEKKRDGAGLSREEIDQFIEGYTTGAIPEYQMAALAMAIYFRGMTFEETAMLTDAIMRSGDLVDTSVISRVKVDKHSTGGIGDKVSLVLAPLLASVGVAVPMISGRGLGITGGTLDKLESIPGYRCDLSEREFLRVVETCGCSITGQTASLAPADKKLYALRDVTGTVPSIPLIASSIMSKKLAEGMDALVLDVKVGSGAFMRDLSHARELATTMVEVGRRMGKKMGALITEMNEPLGRSVGNALEVEEAIAALHGDGEERFMELTLELASQVLIIAGLRSEPAKVRNELFQKLRSGEALSIFKQMVGLHGGRVDALERRDGLRPAPLQREIIAPSSGYLKRVDAELIGKAVVVLGGGRTKVEDAVDHRVGIGGLRKVGTRVAAGEPLAIVHAGSSERLEQALVFALDAFQIAPEPVEPEQLILARV